MRHTSGPWRVSPKSRYLVRTDKYRICQVFKSTSTPSLNEAAMADAQLIAAAPELLEALKDISVWLTAPATDKATIDYWKQKVSTVMAKATGENK